MNLICILNAGILILCFREGSCKFDSLSLGICTLWMIQALALVIQLKNPLEHIFLNRCTDTVSLSSNSGNYTFKSLSWWSFVGESSIMIKQMELSKGSARLFSFWCVFTVIPCACISNQSETPLALYSLKRSYLHRDLGPLAVQSIKNRSPHKIRSVLPFM